MVDMSEMEIFTDTKRRRNTGSQLKTKSDLRFADTSVINRASIERFVHPSIYMSYSVLRAFGKSIVISVHDTLKVKRDGSPRGEPNRRRTILFRTSLSLRRAPSRLDLLVICSRRAFNISVIQNCSKKEAYKKHQTILYHYVDLHGTKAKNRK